MFDSFLEKLKDQDNWMWIVCVLVVGALVYTGKVKPEVLEAVLLAVATKSGTTPRKEPLKASEGAK